MKAATCLANASNQSAVAQYEYGPFGELIRATGPMAMQVSVLTIDTKAGFRQGWSLPRELRLEYPGAIYHVVNRGNRRENLFRDDTDRERFLLALGWTEMGLSSRRKGDKGKVKLARRLRAETTMTLRWIAGRLQMGSWTHVSNRLHEKR